MPKNGKPKGGRPARNFEPRYGAKKTSFHDRHAGGSDAADRGARRPGSVSPKHRGYRPAEEGGAPKQRWSAQERAGRDEARSIRNRAESGRREAPHHERRDDRGDRRFGDRSFGDRTERPRYDRADRPRFEGGERPRFDRNDRFDRNNGAGRDDRRPARDDRPRFDRDARNYRPRFDRNDRAGAGRDDRPRFDRDDRGGRDDRRPARDDRPRFDRNSGGSRPRFEGNDRPRYDRNSGGDRARFGNNDRPRFDRNERPARDDRPRYDRSDRNDRPRTEGNDRPRFNRDDRPARDERPRFDRNSGGDRPRFEGNDRPRFNRDDRPARTERPRFDRDERAARADRPSRSDWNRTAPAPREQTEDVVHERLEAQAVQAVEVADVTFGDLGLGSNIVEILKNLGAETPFPIQAATIPAILEGRDVLGRGRTGSGKTIAFGAPLVESILLSQKGTRREVGRKPRAIILAPTRELALQIDRTVQPIARSVGLFTTQIYGGVPQARQVGALRKGVDIVIGTPGRIEDLINQGKLDLSAVRIAVLDEADHMAELGFAEPVQRILRQTGTALEDGAASQKLLFSATLDREVAALVDEFLVNPAVYEVAGEDQNSGTIDHRVLVIEHRDKAEVLTALVDREGQTLVFARTRAYAEMLAEQFEDAGIPAVSLHGDLNQAKRTRNLQKLTAGKVQVLVATDVAARGIHVDDIDLVVQADAPDEYKTYLHRSGRTGRAGRSGRVVTLITRQRRRRMEDLLNRAEIDAPFDQAQPGDDVIEEITGRMPSEAELTS